MIKRIFSIVLIGLSLGVFAQKNEKGVLFEQKKQLSFGQGQFKYESKKNVKIKESFTVVFWAKQIDGVSTSMVIGHGAKDVELLLEKNQGRALHIGFRGNGQFTFAFYYDDLDTPFSYDEGWHQYACVYNSKNNERQIYIDSIFVASDQPKGKYVGKGKLYIGGTSYRATNFEGHIKNVKVFDHALTNIEVSELK